MTEPKTLTVKIRDAEIRRHASGIVCQPRDTWHWLLRFRHHHPIEPGDGNE